MKTKAMIICTIWPWLWLMGQGPGLPESRLSTLDGNSISTKEIFRSGNPVLLIFWKSASGLCCENLEELQNTWSESLHQQGVRLVAICMDCSGGWGHVKPLAAGKGWDFEIYIDVNGDFKRLMGVSHTPCTILLDENLRQLCRQNSYCSGDGELVCDIIDQHLEKK